MQAQAIERASRDCSHIRKHALVTQVEAHCLARCASRELVMALQVDCDSRGPVSASPPDPYEVHWQNLKA
jgi:hypothetical protein